MNEVEFRSTRGALRTLGPVLLSVGLICLVIALVDFLGSMGSMGGPPKLFWLAMIGVPVLGIGLAITKAGYAGKIARYFGREVGPAASATFNEVAQQSGPGLRVVAGALREPGNRSCPGCGAANDGDARFCKGCGGAVARACPVCGGEADADANFCDACGARLPALR